MAQPSISTSQCYRAVCRHLWPHHNTIRALDGLYASAFERHAATFRAGVRHGSSVPGPLEHRRRLAKRHMGELHLGEPHAAAPIWELSSLVDLTEWKWKPPTLPAVSGRQDTDSDQTPALWNAMMSLGLSLFPPSADAAHGLHAPDAILLPQDIKLSGVAEPLPPMSWDADSASLDVITTALESLSADMPFSTAHVPHFSQFCDRWQRALAKGIFRGEAVAAIVAGVADAVSEARIGAQSPRLPSLIKLLLVEATIEGMASRGTDQNTAFDDIAWNGILHTTSTIQGLNIIRTFTKAAACIPSASIGAVSSGILANVDNYLKILASETLPGTISRQSAKMALPLQCLGRPELRFILDRATQLVLTHVDLGRETYRRVRRAWLLLLVRLPGVDEEYLTRICIALEAAMPAHPLSEKEMCKIFLAWANRREPFRGYLFLVRAAHNSGSKCYRSLGRRLLETGQFHRVRLFCRWLHAVGRETDVASLAQGAANRRRRGYTPLSSVALGMRRPRAAIDIICLFEESRKCNVLFWESRFGFKALEILTWMPDFDFYCLWRALGVIPKKEIHTQSRLGKLRGLSRVEAAKLAAVGVVTALSPYLRPRKAFRLMIDCYLNLQSHGCKVPDSFLRAMTHHATKDIAEGRFGITQRLKYIFSIIRRHVGLLEARHMAILLQRQRRANNEQNTMKRIHRIH
ncbi:putative fungal specific transcription factor domain-containing protein [Rosellinia necatrix]|uniref:Putative fungal specific transcription factor domain-containing protein n=1 Tax=Rosellinia necatrix TaxID=77044 RepID=A0A1W2TDS7_ROSNE|nr:putative fungal specific transcription factor domain-containing protein [Rosellinia necatrix]